jgi:hypothetical protein
MLGILGGCTEHLRKYCSPREGAYMERVNGLLCMSNLCKLARLVLHYQEDKY